MIVRLVIAFVAAGLVAAVAPPQEAVARDSVLAHDTAIDSIYALDGQLVYRRGFDKTPKRTWMVRAGGHLRQATAIPREASVGAIGRDARGRVVVTFAYKSATDSTFKWSIYDLAHNRSRPLGGLPPDCDVIWASLWRDSLAYAARCTTEADSGVFINQGKRTLRVQDPSGWVSIDFRAGTLATIVEDGLDNQYIEQRVAHGKRCHKRIDQSFADASNENSFYPSHLWLGDGTITWTMGDPWAQPKFTILSAKVAPGCDAPGSVRRLPFKAETSKVLALAVDGRSVFYADDKTLRRHRLPANPPLLPPRNDDFEQAADLPSDPPLSVTGELTGATVQRGEPLASTKHTVWYAFRPDPLGTYYVRVPNSCPARPGGCDRDLRYGVYTGASRSKLKQIPPSGNGTATPRDDYTRVKVVAGQAYWISVGSPRFDSFTLHAGKSPPPPLHG